MPPLVRAASEWAWRSIVIGVAVIVGVGGIGINAVQGARLAGAKNVIAIDPLENKRKKALELGATHAFATADEAMAMITDRP